VDPTGEDYEQPPVYVYGHRFDPYNDWGSADYYARLYFHGGGGGGYGGPIGAGGGDGGGGGGGAGSWGGTGGYSNNSDFSSPVKLDSNLPPYGFQDRYWNVEYLRVASPRDALPPLPQFVDNIKTVEIDEVGMAFYDLDVLTACYGVWKRSGFGLYLGEATSYVAITNTGKYQVGPVEWHPGEIVNGSMRISYSVPPSTNILVHSHWTRLGADPYPSWRGDPSDRSLSMADGIWRVVVSNEGIIGVGRDGRSRKFRGPNWIEWFTR